MSFEQTLGSKDWLNQNETALREMFPETWTHVENMKLLPIMYRLKTLGVDWREENEIPEILTFFRNAGVYAMNASKQVMRNHKHLEFEMTYKPQDRRLSEVIPDETEEKEDKVTIPNPVGTIAWFLLLFGWIGGFVLAKGFWSTVCCLCPLWAWYLVVERLFQLWGMIPL